MTTETLNLAILDENTKEILESVFKMLARRGRCLQQDNEARNGSYKNERNKEGGLSNGHNDEGNAIAN
jgi:hypothetical protein